MKAHPLDNSGIAQAFPPLLGSVSLMNYCSSWCERIASESAVCFFSFVLCVTAISVSVIANCVQQQDGLQRGCSGSHLPSLLAA